MHPLLEHPTQDTFNIQNDNRNGDGDEDEWVDRPGATSLGLGSWVSPEARRIALFSRLDSFRKVLASEMSATVRDRRP